MSFHPLQLCVELYRSALSPLPPFTWLGMNTSALELCGTFRLCLLLRQIREDIHAKHLKSGSKHAVVEPRSFTREIAVTLTAMYGGEAIAAPFLGLVPSFMVSGTEVLLYIAIQGLVEVIPVAPPISFELELPFSLLDGFTRAFFLCTLIPPMITNHPSAQVASSSWTLLVTALIVSNGGFFILFLTSLLAPTGMTLSTPPDLLPYGWTSLDLWCAPLITGLYGVLTHALPSLANVHAAVMGNDVAPVDAELARAACALLLAAAFTTRTVRNFKKVGKVTMSVPLENGNSLVEKKTQ